MNIKKFVNEIHQELDWFETKCSGKLIYCIVDEQFFLNGIYFNKIGDNLYVELFHMALFVPSKEFHFTFGERLNRSGNDEGKIFKVSTEEEIAESRRLIISSLLAKKKEILGMTLNSWYTDLESEYNSKFSFFRAYLYTSIFLERKESEISNLISEFEEYWLAKKIDSIKWSKDVRTSIEMLKKEFQTGNAQSYFEEVRRVNMQNLGL